MNKFGARAAPIPERIRAFLLGEDLNIRSRAGVVVNEETAMRTSVVYIGSENLLRISYSY